MFVLNTLLVVGAVQAPVSQVMVFTDQARVVRAASVGAPGTVEFPPLPDTIDPSSVRVDAQGAEVRRVDLQRLTPEAFRTAEAKQLLSELDAVDTELNRLRGELSALEAHRDALSRLSPSLPLNDNVRPALRLAPQGWAAAVQFQAAQLETAQKKVRDSELALRAADRKREKLVDRANKLGNPETRSGWRVTAVLAGGGQATVALTYLVRAARWTPTWDVQLDPDRNLVTMSLAGLVSQESGEDWSDAQLTLSTAIPSSAVKAPKLLTWKIGTTERFIPTPTPVQEYVRTVPSPGAPPRVRAEDALVREWLARLASNQGPSGRATGSANDRRNPAEQRKREEFRRVEKELSARMEVDTPALAPPPPPKMVPQSGALVTETTTIDFDGIDIEGDLVRPEAEELSPRDAARSAPAPQAAPSQPRSDKGRQAGGFSLAPPPGYRAPVFAANSPVTLAGGYDLSFAARQKETIPSAGGARRVALWSQQWPVTVERRVYPALAKEAYLSADLKNPSQQVLPGGPATLSVGADPAGTASLKLVSPGEQVTLPLGLDRAIKPVRNVQVIDATEGVVSKDDVSTYAVTIELVNPYRTAVALRVFDQWPLPQPNQKDLEVKLLDSRPGAIQDAATGKLEWRLTLKPNEKQTLSFNYQVKRPRGWRLYQQEVRP
jgi:hypothetical protein